MHTIASPAEFFGFEPGADGRMIHWDKLTEYYEYLAKASGRIRLVNAGESTEGYPFLFAYISCEDNLARLDEYMGISRRLADPRGLTQREIADLAAIGKCVCMQSMGLHSNEVGGPQTAPILMYELLTKGDRETLEILDNVILIFVPCANPDGEVDFTDWYNKYKGTPYEGCCSPHLRHKYAGHSNNRDAVHLNLIETRYLHEVMMNSMPQAFLDQHHQSPWMDRLTIAPYVNPINPEISPFLLRELEWYGGFMAAELSKQGVKGVVTGDEFYPDWCMFAQTDICKLHNIAGILAESADALIAAPIFMHPDTLDAHTAPSAECPEPWPGGWWHLSDIVFQMKATALALLKLLAGNREQALLNAAHKAMAQTRRGAEDPIRAYLIPKEQHDISALNRLLSILRAHRVELGETQTEIVVPLNQPKYALIKLLLGKRDYPVNQYTKKPDGSVQFFDTAATCITEFMGITAREANAPVDYAPSAQDVPPREGMRAVENASYKLANAKISAGERVYRDSNGDFNTAGEGALTTIPRIGLLKLSLTGNSEEGYTRLLLENYGFPYTLITDRDAQAGALDDIDVFILPGDSDSTLSGGDKQPDNAPPEYRSGLGKAGFEGLQKLIARGGRVIAWGQACTYAARAAGLPVGDSAKGLTEAEYCTHGSALNVNYTPCEFTYGMPERGQVMHWNEPVMYAPDWRRAARYQVFARFADSKVLSSGYIAGEERLLGKPCAMRLDADGGDCVLFGFDPKFRAQTDGTFKLLFNALYRYE